MTDCPEKWFTKIYTEYGKCFSLNFENSKTNLYQIQTGAGNGLFMCINLKHEEYTGITGNIYFYENMFGFSYHFKLLRSFHVPHLALVALLDVLPILAFRQIRVHTYSSLYYLRWYIFTTLSSIVFNKYII